MRFTLFIILIGSLSLRAQNYQSVFKEAVTAYNNEQYSEMLTLVKEANTMRANHQTIMYYLALAYALNNKSDSANFWLQKVVNIDAINYPIESSDFENLKSTDDYKNLLTHRNYLLESGNNSDTVMIISEPNLHIEDIAFNPFQDTYLVSSINLKNIFSIKEGKATSVFSTNFPFAITGMAIQDSILWFTAAGFPEAGISEKDDIFENSMLYKANLNSYQLLDSFQVKDDLPHLFGDLFINPEGNVLVSDSKQNIIYQLGNRSLEKLLHPDSILSLQGIAQIDGTLFFADYVNGIYTVDLENGEYNLINVPEHLSLSLKGIDGLYAFEGDLIAIQNGVNPNRITRIKLSKNLSKIESYRYIENNHPAMGEPTLGFIANDQLYYIANSFWRLNKAGVIQNHENIFPVILKVNLEK